MAGGHVRVDALTTGLHDPSARFRVRQYIEPLHGLGIDVREHIPFIDKHAAVPSLIARHTSWLPQSAVRLAWQGLKMLCHVPGVASSLRADLVWLNRELVPGRYSLERLLKRPIVLDVDDAVWLAKPNGLETMRRLGSESAAVLAGNEYLANWFSQCNRNVQIVPTAIDTDRFRPDPDGDKPPRSSGYVVGWTGLGSNLWYVQAIEEPLNAFLEARDARLLIVSEKAPAFRHIRADRVVFRRWTAEIEATALRDMDVGIMPLPDSPWARGKCSFKMLQYMSTSLPVVVSPVGMNAEVLRRGLVGYAAEFDRDWFDALIAIHDNPALACEMGRNGRRVVLENYSRRLVAEKIAEVFRSLA